MGGQEGTFTPPPQSSPLKVQGRTPSPSPLVEEGWDEGEKSAFYPPTLILPHQGGGT